MARFDRYELQLLLSGRTQLHSAMMHPFWLHFTPYAALSPEQARGRRSLRSVVCNCVCCHTVAGIFPRHVIEALSVGNKDDLDMEQVAKLARSHADVTILFMGGWLGAVNFEFDPALSFLLHVCIQTDEKLKPASSVLKPVC